MRRPIRIHLQMNRTAKAYLQQLEKLWGLKALILEFRSEWGSEIEGHREGIRDCLKIDTTNFSEGIVESSISHCPGYGGYALAVSGSKKLSLGLDIEMVSRVTGDLARRICLIEAEYLCSPRPSFLWVAKEAAFKAMQGESQPKVISSVAISSWQGMSENFYTFRGTVKNNLENQVTGGVFSHEDCAIAIAIKN